MVYKIDKGQKRKIYQYDRTRVYDIAVNKAMDKMYRKINKYKQIHENFKLNNENTELDIDVDNIDDIMNYIFA